MGFNAAKTEFVLPHQLGLLPAGELALAKANPTYANGLANPNDWMQFQTRIGLGTAGAVIQTKNVTLWFYEGSGDYVAAGVKPAAVSYNTEILPFSPNTLQSTSVQIHATTLNNLTIRNSRSSSTPQFVGASALEIQAAPLGTLYVNGVGLPAVCVPTPEAYIANGKVVTAGGGMPVITAGPSTIFAIKNPVSHSSPPIFYDRGTASCAAFH